MATIRTWQDRFRELVDEMERDTGGKVEEICIAARYEDQNYGNIRLKNVRKSFDVNVKFR